MIPTMNDDRKIHTKVPIVLPLVELEAKPEEELEEELVEERKGKLRLKALWITLGIVFGLLIIGYGISVYYFSSHFTFKTVIDGTDCSLKTVEEVEGVISRRVDGYEMLVTGRDGLRFLLTARDVGLRYVSDGQVDKILQSQNPFLWFVPVFKSDAATRQTTSPSVSYDNSKFNTKMRMLDLYNETRMRLPTDAYAVFEGSQYVVHPEDLGSTFVEGLPEKAIQDALLVMGLEVDLNEVDCYTTPEVYADNAALLEKIDTWNTYACFAVTYTFGDKTVQLDASTTMDWVIHASERNWSDYYGYDNYYGYYDYEVLWDYVIEAGGEYYTLNLAAVKAWVHNLSVTYDTVGTTRRFIDAHGVENVVEGGAWGWEISEKAEIWEIYDAFWYHTGLTRKPIYAQEAVEYVQPGEADWGKTYIEIDLTEQHMFYFVDGENVFEADVVTGAPWGGRATPQGVYSVLNKMSPAKLVGEIQASGKPEYETWVTYWLPFTWAGHGMHDANWQPWFGGDLYTYNGSHGCVNMYY